MIINECTDKYFEKTAKIVEQEGDQEVTYAFFLRKECIVAISLAISFLKEVYPLAVVDRKFEEGTLVPSETVLMTVTGNFSKLSMLETLVLQKIGIACVCAYNAYRMSLSLPTAYFMDMHARHASGTDMNHLSSYGASVGSKMAKLQGAKGFVGSSQDITAPYFGAPKGMGTMPHSLVGYFNNTLASVQKYIEIFPEEQNIIALVDYFGQEISDSLEIASWFYYEKLHEKGKKLGIRLDTHGGRFQETLDYNRSVDLVCDWVHAQNEYDAVRKIMGSETYDMDTLNLNKDLHRKYLFQQGVSAASVINLRKNLDKKGFSNVIIVASSGFNLYKCQVFARANIPVNMVGTGSFLPEKLSETFTTADIISYNGISRVKKGREWLLN